MLKYAGLSYGIYTNKKTLECFRNMTILEENLFLASIDIRDKITCAV